MLARILEAAGLATVLVTNMPLWAERIGVPRTLAVEFPFGHALGQPHNRDQQLRVIEQALVVLEEAEGAGTVVHSPEEWPIPGREATRAWQPAEPSPVVQAMAPQLRETLRTRRPSSGAEIE